MAKATTSETSSQTTPHPDVIGWANLPYLTVRDRGPSVIVSPDASPAALMCWAHGQVEQLTILLRIIMRSPETTDEPEQALLAGSVVHQLEQVFAVIGEAVERLQTKGAA